MIEKLAKIAIYYYNVSLLGHLDHLYIMDTQNTDIMYDNIIVDSCGVVNLMKNRGSEKRFLDGVNGSKPRIIIPSFVIKEIRKITGFDKEAILGYFSRFARKISIIECSSDVKLASTYFEEKYPEAHFPDTILLATALFNSYCILTYDRSVIACAKAEGITTFCPKGGFV